MKDGISSKIIRAICVIVSALLGFITAYSVTTYFKFSKTINVIIYAVVILLFAFIFYLLVPKIIQIGNRAIGVMERYLTKYSLIDLVFGTIGLLIGLVLAFFITQPLYRFQLPFFGNSIAVVIAIAIYLILSVLSMKLVMNNRTEVMKSLTHLKDQPNNKKSRILPSDIKILDTSVIIDGRIKEIVDAGFLEGKLIVPIFVLEELQYIADSDNDLRRQKGRRGLDILNILQNNYSDKVEVVDKRYHDTDKVDSKILKMAQEYHAKVITNDYNLNKVAAVQDIEVLNINELANAMKPVYIPGEAMEVTVLKAGKEENQGIGYLEDGTMIVVENGKNNIGKVIQTEVTSVLQTAAGKMIFVRKMD